jgi:hypothetical protein
MSLALPEGYCIADETGPTWVRLGDPTPDIAERMRVSRWNQEAHQGTQDAYLSDIRRRRRERAS